MKTSNHFFFSYTVADALRKAQESGKPGKGMIKGKAEFVKGSQGILTSLFCYFPS